MSFAAVVASGICFLNFLMALRILKESLPPEKRGQVRERVSRVMLWFKYFRKPVLGPLFFILFLATFAMANMEATLFLYVKDKFQWTMEIASYGFAYVGVMMAFTQGYLVRRMMPKLGERTVMVVGLILAAIGMTGIGFSSMIMVLAVVMTVLAIGYGLAQPSILGSISLKADKTEQGVVMGVGQSLSALGRIVGPAVGGWVYGNMAIETPFYIAGTVMVVALLTVALIFVQIPQAGKAHA